MQTAATVFQSPVDDQRQPPFCVEQTLLCSDVVGFTRLTERLGDRRAWLLMERINQRIRTVAGHYAGIERELRGDGFVFTFPHPHAALLAAIAIQRELRNTPGTVCDEAVCLRIALHCGSVLMSSGRLFGRELILAFRLATYARGNQILVSEPARERLAGVWHGAYSPRTTVRPLGFSTEVTYSLVRWETNPQKLLPVTAAMPRIHLPVRARLLRETHGRQIKKNHKGEE